MDHFLKTMVFIMERTASGTNAIEAPKMTRPTRIFSGAVTTIVLIWGCIREMNPIVISRTKLATNTGKATFQPMMKICFEASINAPNHWPGAIDPPIGKEV